MQLEVKLTHVGQFHKVLGQHSIDEKILNGVVESQIKVANYIKSHPKAIVFLESWYDNYSSSDMGPMKFIAWKIFSGKLPDDISKMDLQQKEFLYEMGAVITMIYLDELKKVYRTISPSQSELVDSRIAQGDLSYMYKPRELAAMDSVKEVLESNPEIKEVILVFGSDHDFSKHCMDYGFQHEKVDCTAHVDLLSERNMRFSNVVDRGRDRSSRPKHSCDIEVLNQKLDKCPGDITSRLERARKLSSQWKKEEALKDCEFVLGLYPANDEAQRGVVNCSGLVESLLI